METSTVNGLTSRSSQSSITPQTSEVPERPKRRRFSIAEKRRIVAAADACVPGTLGALLRREGIYSSLLARWRRQRNGGNFDAVVLRQRSSEKIEGQALQRRNAELEVENRKLLNRRLQRAELILEIQKKLRGSWGSNSRAPMRTRAINRCCSRLEQVIAGENRLYCVRRESIYTGSSPTRTACTKSSSSPS